MSRHSKAIRKLNSEISEARTKSAALANKFAVVQVVDTHLPVNLLCEQWERRREGGGQRPYSRVLTI